MAWTGWSYLGVLAVVACGGGEKPANAPACPQGQIFDGRYCQMAEPPSGNAGGGSGGGGSSSASAGGTSVPPAPSSQPSLPVATTSCMGSIPLIDLAGAQPITSALLPLAAQKIMPGSKPMGAPLAAQFQQGQCFQTTVKMSPGKCYSVVATAAPGVQNVDLALVPSPWWPGLPVVVAASDNSVGPNAVLGESPNCFKWAPPAAGEMKLIVSVSAGQGLAAAQIFEK
jgi:hypothetical protein